MLVLPNSCTNIDYYRGQGGYALAGVCLLRAIVSKVLKLALIAPLIKKPDLDSADPRSYKPISTVYRYSIVSKLLNILFSGSSTALNQSIYFVHGRPSAATAICISVT